MSVNHSSQFAFTNPLTIKSIVETSLKTHTLTLQQEIDLKALLQNCQPLSFDTLEPVIVLLTAITDSLVIPTPPRICRLIPEPSNELNGERYKILA